MTTHTSPPVHRVPGRVVRAPLYGQLAQILRQCITTGHYPPGSWLPSEQALADAQGVSKATVRQALSALRAEGLVEVHNGRGSYVLRVPADSPPAPSSDVEP
jgi:DNA-binding GntR family transcriptional regulator